jgi:hypothetical protein
VQRLESYSGFTPGAFHPQPSPLPLTVLLLDALLPIYLQCLLSGLLTIRPITQDAYHHVPSPEPMNSRSLSWSPITAVPKTTGPCQYTRMGSAMPFARVPTTLDKQHKRAMSKKPSLHRFTSAKAERGECMHRADKNQHRNSLSSWNCSSQRERAVVR